MQQYQFKKIKNQSIEIYTDGSCRPNPGVGVWAYIVVIDGEIIDESSQFYQNTTSSKMELIAIREAMWWAIANTEKCDITIYSDSQYAVNAITQWYDSWVQKGTVHKMKNIEIIKKIVGLYNRVHRLYKISWVRGHTDNKFNCIVE